MLTGIITFSDRHHHFIWHGNAALPSLREHPHDVDKQCQAQASSSQLCRCWVPLGHFEWLPPMISKHSLFCHHWVPLAHWASLTRMVRASEVSAFAAEICMCIVYSCPEWSVQESCFHYFFSCSVVAVLRIESQNSYPQLSLRAQTILYLLSSDSAL